MKTKSRLHKTTHALVITLLLPLLSLTVFSQPENKPPAPKTQIVLLGTGTPSPDPTVLAQPPQSSLTALPISLTSGRG